MLYIVLNVKRWRFFKSSRGLKASDPPELIEPEDDWIGMSICLFVYLFTWGVIGYLSPLSLLPISQLRPIPHFGA